MRANGEGAQFYSKSESGFDGQVTSMRLKASRDGMGDYEYVMIFAAVGDDESARQFVGRLVQGWTR